MPAVVLARWVVVGQTIETRPGPCDRGPLISLARSGVALDNRASGGRLWQSGSAMAGSDTPQQLRNLANSAAWADDEFRISFFKVSDHILHTESRGTGGVRQYADTRTNAPPVLLSACCKRARPQRY